METFLKDLRQSARLLARSPGFSLVAISALALGIGATTAVYSVVNSILLQPLPYNHPDRMVRMGLKSPNGLSPNTSIPKFMAWRNNTQAFAYSCAYDFSGPGLNLSGGALPELVKGIHVSSEFFPVFDVRPILGRVFSAAEDKPNGPHLAVMSHGLWVRRFASDPAMIGRPMVLNGEIYTVTGILPASFRSYPDADLFLPLQMDPNSANQGHYLNATARLKPGVTIETANAQMKVAAERFRKAYPNAIEKNESAGVEPFQQSMVGNVKQPLLIMMGAVAMVLLIACANVANLLLARATDRSREIAIRTALGAGRWRIVRQLLTESLLLAMLGGIAGFLLGAWGARALVALRPGNLPRAAEFTNASTLDWHVLAFTMGVAILTGIVFGLFPALQVSRADMNATMKESSSRSGTGRRHWARNILVVGEIAMALVLLVFAALLIRTLVSLRQVNAGFNPSHVMSFETSLAGSKYDTTEAVARLNEDAVRRIERVPGVIAAANVPFLPLEGGFGLGFDVVGRPLPPGERSTGGASWMYVSRDYFKAFEIPLRRGRLFTEQDTAKSSLVMIINEAFAKKYWPKGNPLGERIVIGRGMGPEFTDAPREVVGVIADVKEGGLDNPAPEVMYVPLPQLGDAFMKLNNTIIPMTWVVRTAVNPLTLSVAVEKQILEADGHLAVAHVRAMDGVISEALARQDFTMTLLTVFAAIALLLAAIGVYGMLSYSVQQRAQEIGIRMALGAQRSDVRRMVVWEGMKLAGMGNLIGLALAFLGSRLLTALLFGVKSYDPLTFGAVAAVLAATALIACWIPASRATKVDPLIALRYE